MRSVFHLAGLLFFTLTGACTPASPDISEAPLPALTMESIYPPTFLSWQQIHSGPWQWSCSRPGSESISAQLHLIEVPEASGSLKMKWDFLTPLPKGELLMVPEDLQQWHSFFWSPPDQEKKSPKEYPGLEYSSVPLPLPREPIASVHYNSVLELLKILSTPWFSQVVVHWADYPVPVRLSEAINGPVNLADCLSEAVHIWNSGSEVPWFEIEPNSPWGIRLIHFPDRSLDPVLSSQITRLDDQGRPLRIHIRAGNNYNTSEARPYVVRAMVHELGHALFLWGHSLDRNHCLWYQAAPLVCEPSSDERKAALWWRGLPEGLDLSKYQTDFPTGYSISTEKGIMATGRPSIRETAASMPLSRKVSNNCGNTAARRE